MLFGISTILYTGFEVVKVRESFSHPALDKLYKLLITAGPWETNTEKALFRRHRRRTKALRHMLKVTAKMKHILSVLP